MIKKIIISAILLCCAITYVEAQNRDKKIRTRLDSVLTARYLRNNYDSTYVVRPEGKLTLKLRANQTGNTIHQRGTVNGVYTKADLHTSHKTTISIAASYLGISAGLSINPAKLGGFYKDYELNVSLITSRFSIDASYQRSNTLTGDIEDNEVRSLEKGDATMKVLNMVGYYTFNHRRFSYAAAFNQSFIQRRSAGSWLLGFSYQGGSIKTTDALKEKNPEASDVRMYTGHFGIGGGYGYNLVVGKKWLFHISMLPTFVIYNRNNLTINGERKYADKIRFNMFFNERAAIVYNFSPRYFAGAILVMNNSVFDDNHVTVNQNKWLARAFFGLRL